MWDIALLIVALSLMIFIGTLTINVKANETWVKVKVKINDEINAAWCRLVPGKPKTFFNMDGQRISGERILFVEPCLDSNIDNTIPCEIEKLPSQIPPFR